MARRSGGGAPQFRRPLRFFTANLYYNAILRNTISITALRGSDKTNVIPPEASAELDVRLLPGERPGDFVSELRKVIADSAVEITPLRPEREATTSPLDGALIEAIRETVEAMEPGALITTPMLSGYTDSYYYRAIGIGAYGVSPFRLSEEDARTVHGNDERVTVENFGSGWSSSTGSLRGWRGSRLSAGSPQGRPCGCASLSPPSLANRYFPAPAQRPVQLHRRAELQQLRLAQSQLGLEQLRWASSTSR